MFALIDGNSFYCSCEQVFDPRLRGQPLVVLSNNDGCAIARTDQAKRLGVKMGHPAHELRGLVRDHGLILRSANFALYGDMSRRMVDILRELAPRVEVYSVDESFLDLSGVRDREALAREIRDRIRRWIGIPTCVGLGPTKTLAKAGNKLAKKGPGIVDLTDPTARDAGLAALPVEDVWGVGRRWAAKLEALGITTACELRDAPGEMVLGRFGVVLHRTQRELQGYACQDLQEIEPDRQQIVVSRSFGQRVEDHAGVLQAVATFAERACHKLRTRGLVCSAVTIVANSDAFRPELPQHHPARSLSLLTPTDDTREILRAVRQLWRGFLRDGVPYKRAGVMLQDLARPEVVQGDLFAPAAPGDPAMMQTLDAINARFGRGTAGFGATGWQRAPDWRMRQAQLSPRYTTRLADLPTARC